MGVATAAVVGAAAIGAAATMGSAAMAANAQGKANRRAANAAEKGAFAIEDVKVPEIRDQLLELEELKLSGTLTPEQEQIVNQKQSELLSYAADPSLKDAQMKALNKLREVGDEDGMDLESKAAINEARNETNRNEQSQRAAILQNAAARGMSGSGLEQASQLIAEQGAADRYADAGYNAAADARKRALEAIAQAGTQAGSMRTQDFGEASAKATAQDAINRFNTANAVDTSRRNIDRTNQAQQYNMDRQDQVAKTNLDIRNSEQKANKDLLQQQYNNQMNKASNIANAYNKVGAVAQQAGADQANMWSGVGSAAAKGASAVGSYFNSQNQTANAEDNAKLAADLANTLKNNPIP